jgi:hypothetical protein
LAKSLKHRDDSIPSVDGIGNLPTYEERFRERWPFSGGIGPVGFHTGRQIVPILRDPLLALDGPTAATGAAAESAEIHPGPEGWFYVAGKVDVLIRGYDQPKLGSLDARSRLDAGTFAVAGLTLKRE